MILRWMLFVILFTPIVLSAQNAEEGDLYFRSSAGYGFGEEDIKTDWLDDSGDRIFMKPGGGFNIDVGGGVHINSTLSLEVDFAYQSSWKNLDNIQIVFKKTPLTIKLKQSLHLFRDFQGYGTTGAQVIFSAAYNDKYTVAIFENETKKRKYKVALAGQLGAGFQYQREDADVFFFGEARYVKGNQLEAKSIKYNDVEDENDSTPKVNINGVYLVLGLGYYY